MDEKELEALKTSNPKAYEHIIGLKTKSEEAEKLRAENESLKKKSSKKKEEDPPEEDEDEDEDLVDKARKAKLEADKGQAKTQELEGALKFNLGVSDFVKSNKDLLPTEVEDALKQADKEKYDSALEKAAALKSAMIKTFFSLQANLDLLTSSHKAKVEDYFKLTVKGREEKAADIFENIFEPALEMMKKVKKAEEVGKSSTGHSTGSKMEQDYKNKMMNTAKKTHLGEKGA